MSEQDFSKLSRPIQPMPDSVSELLEERGLMDANAAVRRINRMITWRGSPVPNGPRRKKSG